MLICTNLRLRHFEDIVSIVFDSRYYSIIDTSAIVIYLMANLTNKMSDTENQRMYGLELLEKTVENDIKRKEDNYVVLFHWVLVKEGFRCIGTGDAVS